MTGVVVGSNEELSEVRITVLDDVVVPDAVTDAGVTDAIADGDGDMLDSVVFGKSLSLSSSSAGGVIMPLFDWVDVAMSLLLSSGNTIGGRNVGGRRDGVGTVSG